MGQPLEETAQTGWPKSFRLSFRPFVDYLKKKQREGSTNAADILYTFLIDQFEKADALTHQPEQEFRSEQLNDYFQLASQVLLPIDQSTASTPFAVGLPTPLRIFYHSPAFDFLTRQNPQLLIQLDTADNDNHHQQFIYRRILEVCYQIPLSSAVTPSFTFEREENGLTRYYQIDINSTFFVPQPIGKLPAFQPAWLEYAEGGTLPKHVEPLPLDGFLFEGFILFQIHDITQAESLAQLRDVFVHLPTIREATLYQRVKRILQNLFNRPGLDVSFLPLPKVNGRTVYLPETQQRSVFLQLTGQKIEDLIRAEKLSMDVLLNDHQSMQFEQPVRATPDQPPGADTLYNFLIYPVVVSDEVIGLVELAAPAPCSFDKVMMGQISLILPLLQELLRYQIQQFNDQLEGLIKEKFTPLQPAVSWKFYETALAELYATTVETPPTVEIPLRFPKVYPFYGAIDVRQSTALRNEATRLDLLEQVEAVETILRNVAAAPKSTQGILSHCSDFQTLLETTLNAADESEIGTFLTRIVNPRLHELAAEQPARSGVVNSYFKLADPETGLFTKASKRFEQAMAVVNNAVSSYIDEQQTQLQAVYPHYFERHRTDGVEYTLYAGGAISSHKPFSQQVLNQFRLWQLTTMVGMANRITQLQPTLLVPLQTTQLLLAYDSPVDIRFRRDEHRFDVEGAYSIRYEMLKKRIDKVCIKDTSERLTQPGTIAIVYNQEPEIHPYIPLITQLQQQGQLGPQIESLELQPVQDIRTLKALRLTMPHNV